MKPKKILFILPNLNGGGAERVAINYLNQLDTEKYSITLVVFEKTPNLLELVPKAVRLIDVRTESTSRSFLAVLKILRAIKPDVVFTTHSRVATLLMVIKSFAPRFKHIARMQSTPSLEKKHGAYGSVRRLLYAAGFKNADIVVAQAENMKEDAIRVFGLDESRIRVLPNPVDTKHIDQSLVGETSPFPPDQIAAVASGRLAYPKGFDVLIAALPLVLKRHPNFVLYILGKANGESEKLKALVDRLELENHVKFLGFQSNPYPYYKFCDLFILSSRWEGFPNVLLENYYLNTPIVSTRCVPVVEDLIVHGVNGCLCAPASDDSLAEAISCCMKIHRKNIQNNSYRSGSLDPLL